MPAALWRQFMRRRLYDRAVFVVDQVTLDEIAFALQDRTDYDHAHMIDELRAFRRFRDVLEDEDPRLLAAWYALRGARGRCRAVEWLLDNSLIDDAAAQRYFEEHPEPELP
jgi:hypothetical protein